MEVRNSQFAAFIDVFTPNTYVMVVISDHSLRKYLFFLLLIYASETFIIPMLFYIIASAAMLLNIRNARKHFESIEKVQSAARILR